MLLLLVFVSGCGHVDQRNNVEWIVEHPQFPAMYEAAPELTDQVVKTIIDLEFEVESKE